MIGKTFVNALVGELVIVCYTLHAIIIVCKGHLKISGEEWSKDDRCESDQTSITHTNSCDYL